MNTSRQRRSSAEVAARVSRYDHLAGVEVADGTWTWDADRAMLYAVGVGAGLEDPLAELQFTTENTPGHPQQVIPTFATLMNLPGPWLDLLGIETKAGWTVGTVHGEQAVTLARPIPPQGTVRVRKVIEGVYDKGSGALVVFDTELTLEGSGERLGSTRMNLFVQGIGGFGGPRVPAGEAEWQRPDRAPDAVVAMATGRNQSLIYRLSGDHHPHGTCPERARLDGFPAPILYGLGTYGFACRALLRELCGADAAPFRHFAARFSKPVHPGDRLDTHVWRTDEGALFQTFANGDRLVLDRGVFRMAQ
jgi:acyl dehydratase